MLCNRFRYQPVGRPSIFHRIVAIVASTVPLHGVLRTSAVFSNAGFSHVSDACVHSRRLWRVARKRSNREADNVEFGKVHELVEVDGVSLAFVQRVHYEALSCGRWVALKGDSSLKLVRLQSMQCATAHSEDLAHVPFDDRKRP
eukprot:1802918-Pyramimonas_sp.AAC.1